MVLSTSSITAVSGARQRRLFIVSAPSGAGKTTLCRAVLGRFPDMQYSISHTTRSPRKGEKDGVDYYFTSIQAFESGIKQHKWAEWARVYDNYYGTSAEFIDARIKAGNDVLLDIDVQGASQIIRRYPACVTIFIMPPSLESLRERLVTRETDSSEVIEKRLKIAVDEISRRNLYRHVIVNDELPDAVAELVSIIEMYRLN